MQCKRNQSRYPKSAKIRKKMLAFTASSPTKAAKGSPLWQKCLVDGRLFSPDRFHLLAIVKALWPKYTAKTINPNPPFQGKFGFYCAGDPLRPVTEPFTSDSVILLCPSVQLKLTTSESSKIYTLFTKLSITYF